MSEERDRPIVITPDMLAGAGRDGRIDFERGMRTAPRLILVLIAANAAMFAWELATGALAGPDNIIDAGALVRERVLHGEWLRLVSATFLHAGWDHLVGNCLVLYIMGMACEHAFGFARTAAVYFASGLTGSLLSVALSPGPSVGASGAIFGVVGAVIAVMYRHQQRFYVRDKRIGFVLAAWAVYQITTGFVSPYIDNSAHIGGLLGGGAAGLGLTPRLLSERPTG
ncbi:MAG TPA: rhomboid family intramembrane serine protease [Gemmatimonadales bacterium]|nr:rhomboid family intramembrane serine protease [Gemmatimonadales bacterium]